MKKILFALLLALGCLIVNAQWSDNPAENNRITPLATEIYDFDLGTSNDGTSFIAFNRPMAGNIPTFFQVVDAGGNMLFPEEGMMVSNETTWSMTLVNELIFVDDDGNAIIVVSDCRNSAGDGLSYVLYKVSPTGEMLWGANGIDICGGMDYGLVAFMKMIQLEDGSYVCAWTVEDGSNAYIQLQKISKTGTILWGDIRVQEPTLVVDYPHLVNAGDNQVIMVYSRKTPGMYSDRNLRARKFASDGSTVWASDLSIFTGALGGIVPLYINMNVISDQMGGAFVGWCDFRVSKGTTYIAQVKGNGTLGLDGVEGGVKVGNGPLRGFRPAMYVDIEEGFLYTTWRETIDDMTQAWQRMAAQKLKVSTGELMWNPSGIDIFPYTHNISLAFYSIQGGNADNVAIFFTLGGATWGIDTHKVTLINKENGGYVWNDEIITFSTLPSPKGNLVSTPLQFNNYWLTLWDEERVVAGDPAGKKKLYMQRINVDGTFGDNGAITCLPPTNIVVDPVTYNSAVVTWEGVAANYEVSYRIVNQEWVTDNAIGAHTFTMENLTPLTNYQVRVRSICSADQISVWSSTVSFTTPDFPQPPPCESPANLNVTEITATSAKLSWEKGSDEDLNWDLRYCEATTTAWNVLEAIEVKTYLLEELTPNTAYLWTVRANCSDDRTSDWATQSNFTTEPLGIDCFNKEKMAVFASGKMISIINPDNRYIESVQLFSITGSLLGNYIVNSTDNVLIPTVLSEIITFVKIIGQNEVETHKVLIK